MRYLVLSVSHNHWQQTVLIDHTLNLLESGHEVHWVQVSYFGYSSWDSPFSSFLNNLVNIRRFSKIARQVEANPRFTFEFKNLVDHPFLAESFQIVGEEAQRAVNEEVVTLLRDSQPCTSHTRKLKQHLLTKFNLAKEFFLKTIEASNADLVIIFNGRFLLERSAWLASKLCSKKVIFIERFSAEWGNRYYEFHHPVHSVSDRSIAMIEYPQSLRDSLNVTKIVGEEWFLNRRLALTQKFTSNQTAQFTRPDWATNVISFFHSSEDELFVSDLADSSWSSQFEVIKCLIEICNTHPGYLLVVRLHPNLLNKSERELRKWNHFARSFTALNIRFLMPSDAVNSYSLVGESDFVVTSGSTIGVEAVHMRKPSLLCGLAFHQDMGMLEIVGNPESLKLSLSKHYPSSILELRAELSLKYAVFLAQAGIRVKNLVNFGDSDIQDPWFEYSGIKLRPFRLASLIKRIESACYFRFQLARFCKCIS
jgi:hypothetical protein